MSTLKSVAKNIVKEEKLHNIWLAGGLGSLYKERWRSKPVI